MIVGFTQSFIVFFIRMTYCVSEESGHVLPLLDAAIVL